MLGREGVTYGHSSWRIVWNNLTDVEEKKKMMIRSDDVVSKTLCFYCGRMCVRGDVFEGE